MKLAFDCRYTRIGRHDGISRYTAGVVTALAELQNASAASAAPFELTMIISDERQLEMLPELPWVKVSGPTSVLEPLVALQVNRTAAPDAVISPMQTMGTLGRRYRLALTVHDLIYYSNPEPPHDLPAFVRILWRLYHKAWWPQRMLLNRADAVVTVSHTTEALIASHHLTTKPVVVARNAADLPERAVADAAADEAQTRAAAKTLLYMGSFMPYKNVETLVRAVGELPGFELHLLSRATDADKTRLRAIDPSARLVFHDGVSDEEYHELLQRATALVTASLDEGFGIPLVESMGYGTPVVVSEIPVFHEIGQGAALYAPARDPAAFARQIARLEDPEEWRRRSLASREVAEGFSWEASARALAELVSGWTGRAPRR
ncbi:glycosyltransferase family 1 protein [Herbiconiux sp. KACC 21604]|uniref:glycosyltransferase family 4 protein n=1 Tax=unclassified Herbiconiux TaxID=2618217 RepID=UPI00149246FF|nr:glycosyltransferase family 1 protein [Herbiconiux sp. SALV-R1]QJU53529.1 glycosyltransferase family 4 protein [Herbiconiux sp. SALV-R1]WPO88508.1 glycosyltransferase family 1 protein [Herbiconiux sp. KACC 21604]